MNSTLDSEAVENLGSYLLQTVPLPSALSKMHTSHEFGYVTFAWYGREFLVNKSKKVFELRGQRVFVTGFSMLMEMVVNGAGTNKNRVKQIIQELITAEELIVGKHQLESGLQELDLAKRRLRELVPARRGQKTESSGSRLSTQSLRSLTTEEATRLLRSRLEKAA